MKNQIPWDVIVSSLRNKSGEQDSRLNDWLGESPDNRRLWEEIQVIYNLNGNVPEYYLPDKESGWKNIERRTGKSVQKSKFVNYFIRIAASFLLIVLGAGGYWVISQRLQETTFSEVISPSGHRTQVLLPDSSVVWLNGNSSLKYQTDFSNERNVELKGEALFEVRKDPDSRFTVRSNKLRVEVYGTRFNVKDFVDENKAEVALIEGSVGIFNDRQHLKMMKPGEVVTYLPQENKMLTSSGSLDYVVSWQTDELIVDNKTFREVAKYLERWYGVQITLGEELQENYPLSFKLKSESLRELLSVIDKIIPIEYIIDGKQVTIKKR